LANPATLGFFLFIILSTLRLNPWACRLCGFVAAVTYLVAAFHLGWRPVLSGGTSLFSPQRAVVSYAIAFLVGGARTRSAGDAELAYRRSTVKLLEEALFGVHNES
jgi:hypothetical protein